MDKVEIPEPSGVFTEAWSLNKVYGLLAVFGPAAIVASVAIGAGETIVVVRAGAWAGYGLLWMVLLSCLVKGVFFTYLIGRYTAVSGESIGQRLVRLPGPRGWLLLAILLFEMIGAPLAWVPISKPCGDLFHFLLRDILPGAQHEVLWENAITSAFIAFALLFGISLSFERLEKQQIIICGILVVGTVTGTLIVRPDFFAALKGTFRFGDIPLFPTWAPADTIAHPLLTLGTTFGYVGGSVIGYIAYANWIGLHKWGLTGHKDIEKIRAHAAKSDKIDYLPTDPAQVSRLRKLISPLRWDVSMGAVVLFVVTGAFMISGAAVLFPLETRFEGWSLLTHQAHVWAQIHPSLVWIYYICILAALWGTLQALPEIYARVAQEFFTAIWPDREWAYMPIKCAICLYVFATTMVIVWLNIPFDILTQIAGFLIANLAIAMMMIAAIFLNFKLPAAYRTRPWITFGAGLSTLVLIASAVISGWGLIQKLAG
ncbi:MAG: Nramp family divalent metal transporter [Candidatus Latescibacterota bacterium]|nr:Nramp family divalent metal transporter [Candidatus Latescibacterota bacterium]